MFFIVPSQTARAGRFVRFIFYSSLFLCDVKIMHKVQCVCRQTLSRDIDIVSIC